MFEKFSQSVWLKFLLSCHCSRCRIVMTLTHYRVPIIPGLMQRPYNVNPQQWYVKQQSNLMNPEMLSVHAFVNPYMYHIWNFLFAIQKSWHSTKCEISKDPRYYSMVCHVLHKHTIKCRGLFCAIAHGTFVKQESALKEAIMTESVVNDLFNCRFEMLCSYEMTWSYKYIMYMYIIYIRELSRSLNAPWCSHHHYLNIIKCIWSPFSHPLSQHITDAYTFTKVEAKRSFRTNQLRGTTQYIPCVIKYLEWETRKAN